MKSSACVSFCVFKVESQELAYVKWTFKSFLGFGSRWGATCSRSRFGCCDADECRVDSVCCSHKSEGSCPFPLPFWLSCSFLRAPPAPEGLSRMLHLMDYESLQPIRGPLLEVRDACSGFEPAQLVCRSRCGASSNNCTRGGTCRALLCIISIP